MGLTLVAAATKPPDSSVMRIEAHRRWLALDLGGLWAYRNLIYFVVWRETKIRDQQVIIGVACPASGPC
jgi:lipopolysaccharide transport system permease protein